MPALLDSGFHIGCSQRTRILHRWRLPHSEGDNIGLDTRRHGHHRTSFEETLGYPSQDKACREKVFCMFSLMEDLQKGKALGDLFLSTEKDKRCSRWDLTMEPDQPITSLKCLQSEVIKPSIRSYPSKSCNRLYFSVCGDSQLII